MKKIDDKTSRLKSDIVTSFVFKHKLSKLNQIIILNQNTILLNFNQLKNFKHNR